MAHNIHQNKNVGDTLAVDFCISQHFGNVLQKYYLRFSVCSTLLTGVMKYTFLWSFLAWICYLSVCSTHGWISQNGWS